MPGYAFRQENPEFLGLVRALGVPVEADSRKKTRALLTGGVCLVATKWRGPACPREKREGDALLGAAFLGRCCEAGPIAPVWATA